MSEATFALQILNTLSPLPITRPADFVLPPAQQPTASPVLPRMPKAYIPRSSTAQTSITTTTVSLKPLKGEPVVLEGVRWDASVYDLKSLAGKATGYTPEKIKVLWEKRPASDSKTLEEVVGARREGRVEMGVMFVGAPTVAVAGEEKTDTEMKETPVAQGQSGEEVLRTAAFWEDLRGFVLARVRDEGVAKKVVDGWQAGWERSGQDEMVVD